MSYARLVKLAEARAALEADATIRARKEAEKKARGNGDDDETAAKKGEDAAINAVVDPRAQPNFTDPNARIMKTADGSFHYAYNVQAIVD